MSEIDNEDALYQVSQHFDFDPNDKRYRCCCSHCHSTTGVRIIAGILCLTLLLELWHVFWAMSHGSAPVGELISSTFQLMLGSLITLSVLYATWRESSIFLLPYLFMQTLGLAAIFVVLLALLYVCLVNDTDSIRSLSTHHFLVEKTHALHSLNAKNERYLAYFGWTMIVSCLILLAVQIWLISVVFSCWRYYRDKKCYGYSQAQTSSLVVLSRPVRVHSLSLSLSDASTGQLCHPKRSVSASEPLMQEAESVSSSPQPMRPLLSSISYDYS